MSMYSSDIFLWSDQSLAHLLSSPERQKELLRSKSCTVALLGFNFTAAQTRARVSPLWLPQMKQNRSIEGFTV